MFRVSHALRVSGGAQERLDQCVGQNPEPRTSAALFAPLAVAGVLLLALALSESGCAGERQDVLNAHDAHEGEVRVFSVGMDQAWEAARAALRWNHADTIEEHRAEGYMLATAGISGWSWGAAMGVWLSVVMKSEGSRIAKNEGATCRRDRQKPSSSRPCSRRMVSTAPR